ncbi:Multidrug resistance protein NorM [Symmachiella dynata]|uniref:MATE family efflux transporter n=1 Tax=Symmachiella dynata TaxID=2527995 RepID=UPI0011894E1A|nr:MATE family efflux transporter [Symmachiella dynata]QDT49362.1 Multidrug resistance protein NorM [Symmachiella dynata]
MKGFLTTPPKPGSSSELLRIAVPLVISSGTLSLMQVLDRMFLMWYSTDALAAAMPSGLLHWSLMSIAIGTAGYVNTFVAQYEGAGRPDRVAGAMWQGIYFCIFAAAIMLLFLPCTEGIFRLVGHEKAVQDLECTYFRILCVGTAPFLLSAVLSCFYSGRGRTMTIMWVNLAATVINAALNYWLVFGGWGVPAMGIAGAGWATVIASCLGVAAFIVLLLRSEDARPYHLLKNYQFDREMFVRLLRYGLPSGVHFFVDVACFSAFILLVGAIGKEQLAATNLAFNVNSLLFLPMLGFGTAVMTLVGKRIGEGRPQMAVRTTWIAFGFTTVYMSVWAVILIFAPGIVLAPYAARSNPAEFAAIQPTIVVLLQFVAAYTLFDGMNIVFASAIRGAGDTRFCLIFTFFSSLLLMVIPAYLVLRVYDLGLYAAWTCVMIYIVFLSFGFLLRFLTGQWKSMSVINETPAVSADEPRWEWDLSDPESISVAVK